MGADAIWISPIVHNVEDHYHGYAALDIFRLNENFGSAQDLRELVEECHERREMTSTIHGFFKNILFLNFRDIWVMVDVVPNHMGDQAKTELLFCLFVL